MPLLHRDHTETQAYVGQSKLSHFVFCSSNIVTCPGALNIGVLNIISNMPLNSPNKYAVRNILTISHGKRATQLVKWPALSLRTPCVQISIMN